MTTQVKERPLFIPLKTEYYEQFERGEKFVEYRLYGPRWNEKTCRIGRTVTLSKGYGRKNRMKSKISHFYKRDARTFGLSVRLDIFACFGTLDKPIAEIRMEAGV